MIIEGVVADANVLLSAVVGKAALRVFTDFSVSIHASQFNADEVLEYLPVMAQKYDLPTDLVLLQWHLLPMQVHQQYEYILHLDAARQALSKRDPDDAHPLALAMELEIPLWTNDKDLSGRGVEFLTTAVLIKQLEA
jgi:predicted nucleic acid-binding protein